MRPLLPFLLLFIPLALAAQTATSFCKCICFDNSTIIALNPPTTTTGASRSSSHTTLSSRADHKHPLTCTDCNRAFCLSYNLPICQSASEEDVFTTCFQRDSLKDETVVVVFIIATAGLLVWALLKPWVDRVREKRSYMSLPARGGLQENGT